MATTKREIAEKFGISKRTVANYIERLGLGDHVERVGQADFLDDFAVAAVADALGKNVPQREQRQEEQPASAPAANDAVVAALNARITDLKEQNERLIAELADIKLAREREVAELRSELAEANGRAAKLADRVAGIAERQQAIAAIPWWKRGASRQSAFPGNFACRLVRLQHRERSRERIRESIRAYPVMQNSPDSNRGPGCLVRSVPWVTPGGVR